VWRAAGAPATGPASAAPTGIPTASALTSRPILFYRCHRWQALVPGHVPFFCYCCISSVLFFLHVDSPVHIIISLSDSFQGLLRLGIAAERQIARHWVLYSWNSAMRGAIRPVALGARAALRSRPLGQHAHNPFLPRLLHGNTPRPRTFLTSSPAWRAAAAAAAEAEPPGPVFKDREGADTEARNRNNAQKQVDDRPWHREDSHSQPESTVPDPAGHDRTKGRSSLPILGRLATVL
jgi:hypothetical protein